jgi:hypothetical protein
MTSWLLCLRWLGAISDEANQVDSSTNQGDSSVNQGNSSVDQGTRSVNQGTCSVNQGTSQFDSDSATPGALFDHSDLDHASAVHCDGAENDVIYNLLRCVYVCMYVCMYVILCVST